VPQRATDESFLAFPDLSEKGIPFTRQHIARLIKQGRFPAPIKFGVGTNRWIASEIDAWIAQRKAERDAELTRRRGERA
jgi:prophage regulatory protein